jgi:cyclopropane fatty-acyl-phospholipid synthase-like methyltransferase
MAWLLLVVEIAMLLVIMAGIVYCASLLFSAMTTAPYVPSARKAIESMLDLARVAEGTRVVELGSGNGEICIRAAERGAAALGLELNPILVWMSRFRARGRTRPGAAEFRLANFWTTVLPNETDIVFVYLMPEAMPKLLTKLRREVRPGVKIVSHAFTIPGMTPVDSRGNVYAYEL